MSEALYHVVFLGQIRPGFDQAKVKQNLEQALKLSADHVESMFAKSRVVIKQNLPLAKAQKYEQILFLQGMIVTLEAAAPQAQGTENPSASSPPPAQTPPVAEAASLGSVDKQPAEAPAQPAPVDDVQAGVDRQYSLGTNPNEEDEFPKVMNFEFTGKGGEYFKIWIVNILLTIITFGIYSAWAKVRNKQYFYGNSILDGASFEYTATPIQILKGRIVAAIFIAIVYVLTNFLSPEMILIVWLCLLPIIVLLVPWVIVQGLKFNARYSKYRNISFGFDGRYGEAFTAFILWPIAAMTFFLAPIAWQRQHRFFANNSRYGTTKFEFSGSTNDYFRILGMMLVIGLGGGLAFAICFGIVTALFSFALSGAVAGAAIGVLAGLMYTAFYVFMFAYYQVQMNNVLYNNTQLNEHGLSSEYDVKSYALLVLTNTLGIIFTAGLFIPYAEIRLARYHAEKTVFVAAEPLNNFIAAEEKKVNSLAEGLADGSDLFDVGVGI